MGLNVVGRVLRDRGIENCGRESLSVGDWEDGSDGSDLSDGSDWSVARWFVRIFFCCFGFFLYFCCVVFCIYTLFCVET